MNSSENTNNKVNSNFENTLNNPNYINDIDAKNNAMINYNNNNQDNSKNNAINNINIKNSDNSLNNTFNINNNNNPDFTDNNPLLPDYNSIEESENTAFHFPNNIDKENYYKLHDINNNNINKDDIQNKKLEIHNNNNNHREHKNKNYLVNIQEISNNLKNIKANLISINENKDTLDKIYETIDKILNQTIENSIKINQYSLPFKKRKRDNKNEEYEIDNDKSKSCKRDINYDTPIPDNDVKMIPQSNIK